jgi:CDGSH-type Zn-finger protein/truncated hemoglobin YjbI
MMPDGDVTWAPLLDAVDHRLVRTENGDEEAQRINARLRDSVQRPLSDSATHDSGPAGAGPGSEQAAAARGAAGPSSEQQLVDELWDAARVATVLRVQHPRSAALAEAAAALQDLAITTADESSAAGRLAELMALQAGLTSCIEVAPDGPYLVTNAGRVEDWLGQSLPSRPQLALCRCGESAIKPLCDGTHARIGFSGAKTPERVSDRQDTHPGQEVSVLDNRGTCQHSGFCTDRLATVFHAKEEPFVTASGGRMDEIIRAVRDCPSGALSYAVDDVEARGDVDHHGHREPNIEVSKDGPYRIAGGIALVNTDATEVSRNQGASTEHYALCRCGHSQNKPFCSGMHWYVDFHDPAHDPDNGPTIFEWAGGLPALTRMTRLFYQRHVPQDPLLAPLFATISADHPDRVAKWLAEVFCGPKFYSQQYGGYTRMLSQHVGKGLTEEQRARWVSLLLQSANDTGLPNDPEFRSAFGAYIEWGSRLAVENSQTQAKPPAHMPMPHWDWQTAAGAPGARTSALAAPATAPPAALVVPAADEKVSFDVHIKPMFRQTDRDSMQFAFDLWSHDAVSQHGDAILERLKAGTMPCDNAWPPDRTAIFQRWIETGKQP